MSEFNKNWIIEKGLPEVKKYAELNIDLTIRALHYRLVSLGMTNDLKHYKKVVATMGFARWEGLLPMGAFVDQDRTVVGNTDYEETNVEDSVSQGKRQIKAWMQAYHKNRWENQEYYVEVFVEKKALQAVLETPCQDMNVALCPCKGHPSLTYLNNAKKRFQEAEMLGKKPLILYFGDYDPSGEHIPVSIQENLSKMGIDVQLERIALMEHQVVEWDLPIAPTKTTDSRSANWEGLGQVELDAVEPTKLQGMVTDAINEYFDEDLHAELMEQEQEEGEEYRRILKEYVAGL